MRRTHQGRASAMVQSMRRTHQGRASAMVHSMRRTHQVGVVVRLERRHRRREERVLRLERGHVHGKAAEEDLREAWQAQSVLQMRRTRVATA